MPTVSQWVQHNIAGGWSTDNGDTITSPPGGGGVNIPFLIDAENILFNLDGSSVKVPGTTILNSAELEDGGAIKGVFDYWLIGTAGTPVQHRIVHVATVIKKDDGDGTFTDIFTGMTSGAIPSYAVLEDLLVIASDQDVPQSWDGTTAQVLAGSPPDFAFCVAHKDRLWAAGVDANSSRLYYTALLDATDWSGAGSGTIDVDPRDGDRITGLFSHNNELFIFKGPNIGSIHRITGSAPTGGDAFARRNFARGVGCVAHNTIQRLGNDVLFLWSDGSIRSLSATDRFGDFLLGAPSSPININYLNKQAKQSRLKHAWAAVDEIQGLYVLTLTAEGAATNNVVLVMDARFQPPKWSKVTVISAESVASIVDAASNNQRTVVFGGNDGYLYKWNNETKTHNNASIPYKITTPFMSYGPFITLKNISAAGVVLPIISSATSTFGWTRDDSAQQTISVSTTSGVKLDTFLLDTDLLSGGTFTAIFREAETGGDFRAIQYQITNTENNIDFGIKSFETRISITGESTEDTLDT